MPHKEKLQQILFRSIKNNRIMMDFFGGFEVYLFVEALV